MTTTYAQLAFLVMALLAAVVVLWLTRREPGKAPARAATTRA